MLCVVLCCVVLCCVVLCVISVLECCSCVVLVRAALCAYVWV